jgi:hypothetical protein
MNPLLLAATIFPEILKLIQNDPAGRVSARVSKAVENTVKTTDSAQAEQKLQDPAIAARLRSELATIALEETRLRLGAEQDERQGELRELDARLADEERKRQSDIAAVRLELSDRADARKQQGSLASSGSPVAWVAPALSIVVTLGFFCIILLFVFQKNELESAPPPVFPAGIDVKTLSQEQIRAFTATHSDFVIQIINICVGALATAFATVISFWLGSSQSSRNKDALVATLQTEKAVQTSHILEKAADVVTSRDAPPASEIAGPPRAPGGPGPSSRPVLRRAPA